MSRPTQAERARTSVAEAKVATLTTCPRLGRPVVSPVSVRADDEGAPVVALAAGSSAAAVLRLRPLATVQLNSPDWEPVTLQGRFRLLAGGHAPHLIYRLDVGSVRVGRRLEVVEVEDYRSCEPDPLRHDAPGILAHLRRGHGEQLAACLRANGHATALWAEPRRLDRYGLELGVLDEAGVGAARLNFLTPLDGVEDLSPGLAVVLQRGCGRCGKCATEPS